MPNTTRVGPSALPDMKDRHDDIRAQNGQEETCMLTPATAKTPVVTIGST